MRKRKILELQFNQGMPLREDLVFNIETLGKRIDRVRQVRAGVARDTWADRFWSQVEGQLIRKMQVLAQPH
jgi:hypothetical protein